jgi:WD40 repeat protein
MCTVLGKPGTARTAFGHPPRLWNVTDPAHPLTVGPPLTTGGSVVYAVRFGANGQTLATADGDGSIRWWNLPPTTLTGHTDTVTSVAFSLDEHTLASGSIDGTVRLWNVADPAHPTTLDPPLTGHTNAVYSVAFSPDGHTLATGSADYTVRLWNVTDPTQPTPPHSPHP